MKTKQRIVLVMLAFVIVTATVITITMTRTQGQENKPSLATENPRSRDARVKREIVENGDPVVDFAAPSVTETGADSKRGLRNSKFDLSDKTIPADQIKNFEIDQNSYEIQFGGPLSNLRTQPAFPVGKSTHIIIGKIKSARAFLSNQRNAVYSEFILEVQERLYGDDRGSRSFDREITITRFGGKVRFPSGKLLHFGMEGNPLPKVGDRYLLFLDCDNEAQSFQILTAYALQNGMVVPFDGRRLAGMYIRQYSALGQYNGMKEVDFITTVQRAIEQNGSQLGGGAKKQ